MRAPAVLFVGVHGGRTGLTEKQRLESVTPPAYGSGGCHDTDRDMYTKARKEEAGDSALAPPLVPLPSPPVSRRRPKEVEIHCF